MANPSSIYSDSQDWHSLECICSGYSTGGGGAALIQQAEVHQLP